jgi:hypothetical protein
MARIARKDERLVAMTFPSENKKGLVRNRQTSALLLCRPAAKNPLRRGYHLPGRTDLSPKPQGLGEQTPQPPSFFLLSEAPQGRLNDVSIAPVGAHGVFGAGIL